ncbi:hypothetical protein [Natronorubrum halalkaliphilum]|uniref:hypothetical protein n=1 Tax=Natronorubrum halalkaliphilum TaxID=2691917 RepID=UPI00135C5E2A|nr:hypothetical protein [Natronorubrum halalkaliphilum]
MHSDTTGSDGDADADADTGDSRRGLSEKELFLLLLVGIALLMGLTGFVLIVN